MEICTHCNRFERRYDFDAFSMSDYQSCENCRHLGPGLKRIVVREGYPDDLAIEILDEAGLKIVMLDKQR